MKVIQEKTKMNSARHNNMVADDAEQWDAAEVSLAEMEMRQAMEQMVDNEMNKIKVHQVLIYILYTYIDRYFIHWIQCMRI